VSIVIKCEMCNHSYPLDPLQRPHERDVPDEWLTLVRGNPQTNAGFDFCSEQCLTQWLTGNIAPPQTTTSTLMGLMYGRAKHEPV
jgi:hypothetical protein